MSEYKITVSPDATSDAQHHTIEAASLADALREAYTYKAGCLHRDGSISLTCPDGAIWGIGGEWADSWWRVWYLVGQRPLSYAVDLLTAGDTDADIARSLESQTPYWAGRVPPCGIVIPR